MVCDVVDRRGRGSGTLVVENVMECEDVILFPERSFIVSLIFNI